MSQPCLGAGMESNETRRTNDDAFPRFDHSLGAAMNRTGLIIALTVAFVSGLLFGIYPELDLKIARLFYNEGAHRFAFGAVGFAETLRRSAMWIAWSFTVPAFVTLIGKLIWRARPPLIPLRAATFLLVTIFLTAGVLPNVIFKDYWGRPRPIATQEFNGPHAFKAWWDPTGSNPRNGSFFSGEAATAFWTYAPAALAPLAFRPLAFLAATLFGLATGILRMSFGGHYASDVIAAGVVAFLIVWLVHGFLYRWKDWKTPSG